MEIIFFDPDGALSGGHLCGAGAAVYQLCAVHSGRGALYLRDSAGGGFPQGTVALRKRVHAGQRDLHLFRRYAAGCGGRSQHAGHRAGFLIPGRAAAEHFREAVGAAGPGRKADNGLKLKNTYKQKRTQKTCRAFMISDTRQVF